MSDSNCDECRTLRRSTRKRNHVQLCHYFEGKTNSDDRKTRISEAAGALLEDSALLTAEEVVGEPVDGTTRIGTSKTLKKAPRNLKTEFEPKNWRTVLDNIRTMREKRDAPVDVMGAEKCADTVDVPQEVTRFHVLVSLMLSSQTKDHVTHAAMEKLKANDLSVDAVLKMNPDMLGKLIYPVSFWKTKVANIIKVARILNEQYSGDVPDTVEGLCSLPGVGPKMAHLCMDIAWDKLTGIGVDTHVHRISNRLGWVRKPTKTPEQTRTELESWLPREFWREVNLLLVGFGQQVCKPIGPKCADCLNNCICPHGRKQKKSGF